MVYSILTYVGTYFKNFRIFWIYYINIFFTELGSKQGHLGYLAYFTTWREQIGSDNAWPVMRRFLHNYLLNVLSQDHAEYKGADDDENRRPDQKSDIWFSYEGWVWNEIGKIVDKHIWQVFLKIFLTRP